MGENCIHTPDQNPPQLWDIACSLRVLGDIFNTRIIRTGETPQLAPCSTFLLLKWIPLSLWARSAQTQKDRVKADSKSIRAPLMSRTSKATTQSKTYTGPQSRFGSRRSHARAIGVLDGAAWLAALTLVVTSAIWTKQTGALPALVGVDQSAQREAARLVNAQLTTELPSSIEIADSVESFTSRDQVEMSTESVLAAEESQEDVIDSSYRWFDGKLVRPGRVIYMTVTGYSPDARSCGIYADGKTATMNSVWTNGMKLVAADPKVLPYWSMVSVPGYASNEIVPVLDCGGAIKGNRLDLLYPTHRIARQWGVRQVPVTVWEYVETE